MRPPQLHAAPLQPLLDQFWVEAEMSELAERGVLPPQTHHFASPELSLSPPLPPQHPASANLELDQLPGALLGPTQAIVLLLKDEG